MAAEDPNVQGWLSNLLAWLGGIGTGLLTFVIKWRSMTLARITLLEQRVEDIHKIHADCLEKNAVLAAKIVLLEQGRTQTLQTFTQPVVLPSEHPPAK